MFCELVTTGGKINKNMKWIDTTELNQWADERSTEGLLPELIQRLIYASIAAATEDLRRTITIESNFAQPLSSKPWMAARSVREIQMGNLGSLVVL